MKQLQSKQPGRKYLALAFLLLLVMDLVASAWALPVLDLLGAVYALLHSRGALDLFARA